MESMRFIILLGHLNNCDRAWTRIGFSDIWFSGKGSISEVLIQEAGICDTTKKLDEYEWVSKKGRLPGWDKWKKQNI